MTGQVEPQHLTQPAQPVFACAVSAVPRQRHQPGGRRNIDQVPAAAGGHQRVGQTIAARVDAFQKATKKRADTRPVDLARGRQLFTQTCAVCHRFRNEGGTLGPNLDAVAARGVHRLVERDKEIDRLGERVGSVFIVIGALGALVLAFIDADTFWIANVIYVCFVLSAILSSVTKLIVYRRGMPTW